MSGTEDKPKAPVVPIDVVAKLAELEQAAEENTRAVLQLHAVIEGHERRIAVLELQLRDGRPPTDPARMLRDAAEISSRVAKRR